MQKSVTLRLPSPCHQSWASFTPTPAGGFCQACQKEVIDFTTWSDEAILAYFSQPRTGTCGRFKATQIKTYAPDKKQSARLRWTWAAALSGVIVLFSAKAMAQSLKATKGEVIVHTSPVPSQDASVKTKIDTLVVRGVVIDENREAVPGINIVRRGTSEGIVSGDSGKFEMVILNPADEETLVFSFIGSVTQEIVVTSQPVINLTVRMRYDMQQLGEVVVGGAIATRRISPRRWWWGFKNLFR